MSGNEFKRIQQAITGKVQAIEVEIKPSGFFERLAFWLRIKRSKYILKIEPPTMATRIAFSAALGDALESELQSEGDMLKEVIKMNGDTLLKALVIALHNDMQTDPPKHIERILLNMTIDQIAVIITKLNEAMEVGFFLRCTELIRSMALPSSSISSK